MGRDPRSCGCSVAGVLSRQHTSTIGSSPALQSSPSALSRSPPSPQTRSRGCEDSEHTVSRLVSAQGPNHGQAPHACGMQALRWCKQLTGCRRRPIQATASPLAQDCVEDVGFRPTNAVPSCSKQRAIEMTRCKKRVRECEGVALRGAPAASDLVDVGKSFDTGAL